MIVVQRILQRSLFCILMDKNWNPGLDLGQGATNLWQLQKHHQANINIAALEMYLKQYRTKVNIKKNE